MGSNPYLQQAIAEKSGSKSVSGKLTLEEYERFTSACAALGLNKNTAATAILRAGIDDLEAAAPEAKPEAPAKDEAKAEEAPAKDEAKAEGEDGDIFG
jgi:hypothetical protein